MPSVSIPSALSAAASLSVIVPTQTCVALVRGIEAKWAPINIPLESLMAKPPSISINKLAEFMFAGTSRQRQILKDCKYPTDFKGMYYKEADESISAAIASNLEDLSKITNQIAILEQMSPEKLGTQRRITSNIDALERFMGMVDDIDLKGSNPSHGTHAPQKLTFYGVSISVRPQVLLKGEGKKGPVVGALKLHFPRQYSLQDQSAGIVSAVLQEWCKACLPDDGLAQGDMCCVIDVGAKKVFPGVRATAARLKDVESACQNIAALWPTI